MTTQLSVALALFDHRPSDDTPAVSAQRDAALLTEPPAPSTSATGSERTQLPAALREVLDGPLCSAIEECFQRMEIAEEAINRFADDYPERRDEINRAFGSLCWQLPVRASDRVFRAHVEELLQRVVDRASLEEATRAEVLMLLSEGSLIAPLGPQRAALFVALFEEVWGEAPPLGGEVVINEPWKGASNELLDELRRKFRARSRRLKRKGDRCD